MCLIYPADIVGLAASLRRLLQVRNADGSIADMEVDPLFPGTERSVVRLINCWWDAKVRHAAHCQDFVIMPVVCTA